MMKITNTGGSNMQIHVLKKAVSESSVGVARHDDVTNTVVIAILSRRKGVWVYEMTIC